MRVRPLPAMAVRGGVVGMSCTAMLPDQGSGVDAADRRDVRFVDEAAFDERDFERCRDVR